MSNEAPQLGWGHININVTDLDRSVAFYQKLGFSIYIPGIPYLGLTSSEFNTVETSGVTALGLAEGARGRACIMQLGRGYPKIDLIELDGAAPASPLPNDGIGIVRLCLASGDLAKDFGQLSDAGVNFISEPQTDSMGLAKFAICWDPDGALIELIEIDAAKWISKR